MVREAFYRYLNTANKFVGKRQKFLFGLLNGGTAAAMITTVIRQKNQKLRDIRNRRRDLELWYKERLDLDDTSMTRFIPKEP